MFATNSPWVKAPPRLDQRNRQINQVLQSLIIIDGGDDLEHIIQIGAELPGGWRVVPAEDAIIDDVEMTCIVAG